MVTDKPAVTATEQEAVQESDAGQEAAQTDVRQSESSLIHKLACPLYLELTLIQVKVHLSSEAARFVLAKL